MTDQSKPPWNDDFAGKLLGKHIIIGITRLSADEELMEQRQMHGDIVVANEKKGIGIRLAGSGGMYWLPPDLSAIQVARPGEYRFRSTGEVVVNPDLTTTWTVKEPTRH